MAFRNSNKKEIQAVDLGKLGDTTYRDLWSPSLHASRDKSSAIQYILSHSVICALRTLRFCSFWLNRLELLILCHRWPTMFASAELKWEPIVKWAGLRRSLGWNRDPRKRARSSSNFGGFIYIFVRGLVGRRLVIERYTYIRGRGFSAKTVSTLCTVWHVLHTVHRGQAKRLSYLGYSNTYCSAWLNPLVSNIYYTKIISLVLLR